jgi:hypothetical protein
MRLPRPALVLVFAASSLAGAGAFWWQDTSARVAATAVGEGPRVRHPVHVSPGRQPVAETHLFNHHGDAATVSCMACHATREPNLDMGLADDSSSAGAALPGSGGPVSRGDGGPNGSADRLQKEALLPTEFHQDLHYAHGGLSCLSCHDAGNYDSLRRADGRLIAFPQAAQQLCTQCHGTQARDYERGAHGGMRGYWDLSRGERTRNSCIDCHDPHAPGYPAVSPVFPPQDPGARQQAIRAILHGHD